MKRLFLARLGKSAVLAGSLAALFGASSQKVYAFSCGTGQSDSIACDCWRSECNDTCGHTPWHFDCGVSNGTFSTDCDCDKPPL